VWTKIPTPQSIMSHQDWYLWNGVSTIELLYHKVVFILTWYFIMKKTYQLYNLLINRFQCIYPMREANLSFLIIINIRTEQLCTCINYVFFCNFLHSHNLDSVLIIFVLPQLCLTFNLSWYLTVCTTRYINSHSSWITAMTDLKRLCLQKTFSMS
jgi:hypothetical protein